MSILMPELKPWYTKDQRAQIAGLERHLYELATVEDGGLIRPTKVGLNRFADYKTLGYETASKKTAKEVQDTDLNLQIAQAHLERLRNLGSVGNLPFTNKSVEKCKKYANFWHNLFNWRLGKAGNESHLPTILIAGGFMALICLSVFTAVLSESPHFTEIIVAAIALSCGVLLLRERRAYWHKIGAEDYYYADLPHESIMTAAELIRRHGGQIWVHYLSEGEKYDPAETLMSWQPSEHEQEYFFAHSY